MQRPHIVFQCPLLFELIAGLAEHVVKVAAGGLEDVSEESSSTRAAECGSWWKDVCLKIVDPATNTEVAEGHNLKWAIRSRLEA